MCVYGRAPVKKKMLKEVVGSAENPTLSASNIVTQPGLSANEFHFLPRRCRYHLKFEDSAPSSDESRGRRKWNDEDRVDRSGNRLTRTVRMI